MSELDDLLDVTLDDLEDLPSFEPFIAGAHKVLASMESKEVAGKPAIELTFKLMETLEQADPQAKPPVEGDVANTLYFLDNEFGRGKLKKVAKIFGEALGVTALREVVEQVTDIECVIVSGVKIDKNDPDKKYLEIKDLQVV